MFPVKPFMPFKRTTVLHCPPGAAHVSADGPAAPPPACRIRPPSWRSGRFRSNDLATGGVEIRTLSALSVFVMFAQE